MQTRTYNKLAEIYDYVMKNVRYDLWSEYIYSISQNHIFSIKKPQVLELAGGNCNFADYFSRYYPNLIVTDLSLQMLLNSKNKKIKRICCDMTCLPFKKKFELIYSTFDSVNYLTNKKSLLNLFIEVKKILSDDGIFTFDVSLENNSFKHIKNPVREGTYKGINYLHKSIYNRKSKIHKNIFEIKYGSGEKFKEIHKQKIYPFEIYFQIIEKAGLYVAECFNTFTFDNANADSERVQFVIKNKK